MQRLPLSRRSVFKSLQTFLSLSLSSKILTEAAFLRVEIYIRMPHQESRERERYPTLYPNSGHVARSCRGPRALAARDGARQRPVSTRARLGACQFCHTKVASRRVSLSTYDVSRLLERSRDVASAALSSTLLDRSPNIGETVGGRRTWWARSWKWSVTRRSPSPARERRTLHPGVPLSLKRVSLSRVCVRENPRETTRSLGRYHFLFFEESE